jgi:hypothetical protein
MPTAPQGLPPYVSAINGKTGSEGNRGRGAKTHLAGNDGGTKWNDYLRMFGRLVCFD